MNYIFYNPNPHGKIVDDCTIRAICKLTGLPWDYIFIRLTIIAYEDKNMLSSNSTWGKLLEELGYFRIPLPIECPNCYRVKDICRDFPEGKYLIAADGHVVTVIDGKYYDAWDSGDCIGLYLWLDKENERSILNATV